MESVSEKQQSSLIKKWDTFTNFLEENRQAIFFLFVFYVITIALFVERFICKKNELRSGPKYDMLIADNHF